MATITLDPQPVPLTVTSGGGLRIAGTRIPLEVILEEHKNGDSAQEIADAYESLQLADVYAVLAYYHNNFEEVEAYLEEVDKRWDEIKSKIDANPEIQALRERLRARKQQAQFNNQ